MKKNKRIKISLLLLLILILLYFTYYFVFVKYNFGIPCMFYKLTGLYCPGCGITRMLFSLIKLDFYQSFRYNSLLFISLPFIIYLLGDMFIKFLMYKDNYIYKKISNKVWYILLIIVLFYGIIRNVPMFEFLKPTDIM